MSVTRSICLRAAGEQTKTARRGQPRVGNGSEGRVDTEEWAHSRVEHTGAGKGSSVNLGEWGAGDGVLVEYVDY